MDTSSQPFKCVECNTTQGWLLVAVGAALLIVVAVFVKFNSTRAFQRLSVPIRVGLVYIQGMVEPVY